MQACNKWRVLSVLLALGLICGMIYANTINAPFMFDDTTSIKKNPHIRLRQPSLTALTEIFQAQTVNRPLAYISFALNYYFHRYDVAGYHVVNWLIHIINGLLVYLLACQTLRLMQVDLPEGPFLAAALWLVNPVHTQSVTYIVQRMNALSAMFYLTALVLYIRARTIPSREGGNTPKAYLFFFFSAVSGICALASKEIAVTLPVMIFLYEWFFIRNLTTGFIKKQAIWLPVMAVIMILVTFVYLGVNPVSRILSTYDKQPFDMKERLLTQPRVIFQYISLLLLPLPERLSLDHYVTISTSLTNPMTTWPAGALLTVTILAAAVRARANRLFAFAVFWFLGTLAVESSFIGLGLMFEHRTYLPSVFVFIAAACGLLRYTRPGWLAKAALVLLIAVSGFWTWQRNAVWADEIRFWQDTIRKSPKSIRPYNNLGVALALEGRFEEGIAACRQSIALSSPVTNTANAYNNISRIYQDLGENKKAIDYGRRALQINPKLAEAHMNLGKALLAENRPDEAIAHLKKTIDLSPQLTPAYTLLAQAIYRTNGDIERAADICRQALATDPENTAAEIFLAYLLRKSGEPEQSLFHLRQVLDRFPDNFQANLYAGMVYNQLNQPLEAIVHLIRASKVRPDDPLIPAELKSALAGFNRMTRRLAENRQYEAAVTALEELERLLPSSPTVSYNLACLYARLNQPDKAVQQLKKAIEKGYDDWETVWTDTDLKAIRDTPFFQELKRFRGK